MERALKSFYALGIFLAFYIDIVFGFASVNLYDWHGYWYKNFFLSVQTFIIGEFSAALPIEEQPYGYWV